ncbi:hypothetical protein J2I47_12325 [Fibrella sp. HMF5335]|uniref:Uncharacterized protein n=1 Tax=Fibrella rubiginis TaxID=2817060 RepID=A0A939GHK6_9BACT|nr:hypothetical protein [Fibrella rubiginis]MBO0937334.1 hypothetical protein [Fibrella rubiginis]
MNRLFWLFLVLLLATAYHRTQHFDEAWCAEQAYWLVQDGHVHSEFFRGMDGSEQQLFVFHKLFVALGALVQGWLGFSPPIGKAIGAFWTLVGGLAIWWHLRWLGLRDKWISLALLLYVANGMLIEYTFVYRPESMYAALGFLSFSFLNRGRLLVAALLAGLSVLTHLNGLCFVLAGLGWLLWNNHRPANSPANTPQSATATPWPTVFGFGFVAALVSSFYLADALFANQLAGLWDQFSNISTISRVSTISDKLLISSKLHELLFHSEEETSLSALVIGVVGLTYWPGQYTLPKQTIVTSESAKTGRYLLLLLLAFALITKSNTDYYYLIFLPFMCVWVTQCVASWSTAKTAPVMVRWRSYGLGLLLGVYLLAGAYKAVVTIQSNMAQPNIVQKNAQLAAYIQQPGARVIAPLDFFYNQHEHYRIHGLTYYHLLNQKSYGGRLTVGQFFGLAEADGAVAVISDYGRDFSYCIPKETPARVGRYERVYQDDLNAVYLLRRKK